MTIRKQFTALLYLFTFGLIALIIPVAMAQEEEASNQMESMGIVKLQSLDKVTARNMTFEVKVGNTVKFGQVFIKVQSCRKTSPIDKPEAASFLQIWEVDQSDTPKWIFSGWMFASSPGLSAMDHPIYDVWVLDCLPDETAGEAETNEEIQSEDLNDESAGDKKPEAPIEPEQPLKSIVKEDLKAPETPNTP